MVYLVILDNKLMGVYTCPTDANTRMKFLGGGQMIEARANSHCCEIINS